MMRSLYSAVSGLKTHQTRMDVIGNNIANVNTEAFKSSRVTFSEIMYQTISSASGGNGATGVGGINAKQIGLGVSTGATYISITSAGAAETTGNPFDLKLTDSQTTNFFIVSDGTNTMFTRAGSYYVDGNGYLCMSSTGYTLMGWQVDPTTGDIKKDTVSALQVMSPANQTSAPEATTKGYVSGILDKNDSNVKNSEDGYAMTLQFFDDLGYSYTAKFAVKPKLPTDDPANKGKYLVELAGIIDSEGVDIIAEANAGNNADAPISLDDLFSTGADMVDENGNLLDADGNIVTLTEGQDYYYYTEDGKQIISTPVYLTNGTGDLLDANNNVLTLQAAAGVYYYTDADGNQVISTPAYRTNAAGNYVVNVDGTDYELTEDAANPGTYYYTDAAGTQVSAEREMLVQNGYVVDANGNPLTYEEFNEYYTYTDANGNQVISTPAIVPDADGNIVDANGNILTLVEDADYYTYDTTDENGNPLTVVSEPVKVTNELIFDTNEGTFISIGGADTAVLRMSQILSGTVDPETGRTSNFEDIVVDFTSCLNYENGGTSTMKALKGDVRGDGTGKKLGALTGLSVDSSGKVYGSYDNGNTVLLCQVAVAQFANASGLEKVGDNCYQTTLNSGDFNGIGVEIQADGSSISTGELEMSNVDLSAQFTDMIITQRGFQANSRVITTSDTLLEELINLKR